MDVMLHFKDGTQSKGGRFCNDAAGYLLIRFGEKPEEFHNRQFRLTSIDHEYAHYHEDTGEK